MKRLVVGTLVALVLGGCSVTVDPGASVSPTPSPWPVASGWWCPKGGVPQPYPSYQPGFRRCSQAEVDHVIYGKPWPGDCNNNGVIDDPPVCPTPAEGYWCYGGLALPVPHPSPVGVPGELPCRQEQVDFYVHWHPELDNPVNPGPLASGWWCGDPSSSRLPDPHQGSPRPDDRVCYQSIVDFYINGKPWPTLRRPSP
jgi:hypothetical protein